ncbi:MAG: hypothetical protein JWM75_2140 [Sphingomonas bacterium]|nr:hypothetical protein [Sphingomonas bacterium]
MKRIPIALAALAIAVPAVAQPPRNPFVERLRAMDDLQRRAVLRGALVNSGQRCGRADTAVQRGRYRNLAMWSVRCTPGGDYGIFIGPDGTAQVRPCADLVKLALPACALPPAPAKASLPKKR